MRTKRPRLLPLLSTLCVVFTCTCCSVFKRTPLQEGEHILESYKIEIEGKEKIDKSEFTSSIRQKPPVSVLGIGIGGSPVVYSQRSTAQSKTSIEERLHKMGWYGSSVDTLVSYRGNSAKVTYRIRPGHRIPIRDIVWPSQGDSLFVEDFLADTSKVLIRRGEYLCEDVIDNEISRSITALKREGYYTLDHSLYRIAIDTLAFPGEAIVHYDIAGRVPKSHIDKVEISFPQDMKVRRSTLEGLNLLRPGDVYNADEVSSTYSRFSSIRLFQSVGINMALKDDDDDVDCTIALTQSRLQGFRTNLEASTNSSGLLGISPQLSYYHKNLFGGGEWLNIGFTGNFQFKLSDDTRATELGVSTSLNIPGIPGVPLSKIRGSDIPHSEFNVAFSHQNRPEYTRNIFSGSVSYSGMLSRRFSYKVYPFQIGYVRIFDLNESFAARLQRNPYMRYSYQDHTDAGVSATLTYFSDTRTVPTSSYWGASLQGDISGNVISLFSGLLRENSNGEKLLFGAPFSQYARAELSLVRALRFGSSDAHTLAFRLTGGVGSAYGNSSAIPYEKQFYVGGASSMRGWQARSLGPGYDAMDETFSIPSQTGNMKLEADIEYRFPLFWILEGALFAETGNVWDKVSGLDFGALAADYGIGLRLNAKLVLVRLDFGMQLRNPSLEQMWLTPAQALSSRAFALHFGVGYPF